MTDEELLFRRVAAEQAIMNQENFHVPLLLEPAAAICLIASLQLALRHPGNTGEPAKVGRSIIDGVTEMFRAAGYSAFVEIIGRGDNPAYDYLWEKQP